MSRVPPWLIQRLAALTVLAGIGGGTYVVATSEVSQEALRDEYVQAVAADKTISDAVKIAMVMGLYYESSGKHIGKPFIDKLGKGQPWTVCNGITPAVAPINPGKYYTPSECFDLEKRVYVASERQAAKLLWRWATYNAYQQASFIDFVHVKGATALTTSTMRGKANAGDLVGACRENPRWNRGTVKGVSTILPGLNIRAQANAEICESWGQSKPA